MKKRALSLALALVMCLAMLPMTVSALSDGTFEYTLSDDGVTITGLSSWEMEGVEHIVIPSSIAGKPVTAIHDRAFAPDTRYENELKSVVIPGTVKRIGNDAFISNYSLGSVSLSEGLEEIGRSAFAGCGLTSVVIPESVTVIGQAAFYKNGNLTSMKLPSSTKEIPPELLYGCSSLTSLEIPSTVTKIGFSAFNGTALTSLTIPEGVTEIPSSMCGGCRALKEVDLPAGITSIGVYAFKDCGFDHIYLPTSLTVVCDGAFQGSALEQVILPYGLTTTSNSPFMYCENLTEIYVPSTMKGVGGLSGNVLAYCMPDSEAKAYFESKNISCLTDASCDTRINVLYNGKRVSFGAYGQNPTAVNGRTLVPLRSIFEAMGAEVQWDQETQTVTASRGSTEIVMTIGQSGYTVNGETRSMDTPPMAMNNRTMVPVRVVAESFGANVGWHAASATVIITE